METDNNGGEGRCNGTRVRDKDKQLRFIRQMRVNEVDKWKEQRD